MKVEDGFQQPRIELPAAYSADPVFQALLERLLPPRVFEPVERELKEFEIRLAGRESSCLCALENSLADIGMGMLATSDSQTREPGRLVASLHRTHLDPVRSIRTASRSPRDL
jgi:hypothetical protein